MDIFIYLGTDFVTDGSLHSAVSESLAQNSKDCVVNESWIQSITVIIVAKILHGVGGKHTMCIM